MNIVLISDVRLLKERKLKELEFYNEQLQVLQLRRVVVVSEIELTNRIIDILERDYKL